MNETVMSDQRTSAPNLSHSDVVIARTRRRVPLRRILMIPLAMLLFFAAWETYKWLGPDDGGEILGHSLVPRAGDSSMPHVYEMFSRLGRPEVVGNDGRTVLDAVVAATWYSFRVALLGLALGSAIGLAFAIVMARFNLLKKAFVPYLIASQTVPLIALAPIVVSWSGKLKPFGFEFEKWTTTALLGAFLAFFPIAVGALRGFGSPAPASLELMDSYAATWWQSFRKLLFPSSVPYLAPAFRLAAAASVVGVVVSEISIGVAFGIGRLILVYAGESDPAKVYSAVFGAVVLGLAMAGVAAAIDHVLMRNRPVENPA